MATKGQMRLGAFFNPTGHHVASWRHPQAQADAGINFKHYAEITQTAERAKFDMVFFADNLCVREANMEALSRSAQYIANFEPLTLLAALSSVTSHIGLVATASTSYNEPFHVARKFASIDHLSGGRAGWNLVTSGMMGEANNFNRDVHYEHGERYHRAREFAQVVVGLWDSWDDDAFVRDKASGLFFHGDKLHRLNHKGELFSVRGPLNVPRTPQGRPVIVQAGGSDDMIEVAAEFGEVIFCAPLTIEQAKTFYTRIKSEMDKHDRAPEEMKIMPGLSAIVGRTEARRTRNTNTCSRSSIRWWRARSSPWCSATSISRATTSMGRCRKISRSRMRAAARSITCATWRARRSSRCGRWRCGSPARGRRASSAAHRSRSPITWRSGSARTAATAST
jgi:FMN-dependent oxidoreductase (nitrilotriacetate monooxygenase family)